MKRFNSVVCLTSLAILNAGCAIQMNGGSTSSNTDLQTTDQVLVPSCSYGFDSITHVARGYRSFSDFYQETNKQTSVGEPINDGAILYYAKFNQVNKFAVTQKPIFNKDASPLTGNWVWGANEEREVISMFTSDDKNWWYLIEPNTTLSYGYWTSAPNGLLCGNVVSYFRNNLTTGVGMSRIYQNQKFPISFIDKPVIGKTPVSVSISVVKVTGAAAQLEINAMTNGRAIYTERVNVDIVGGAFTVGSVKFATKRKGNQSYLVSAQAPDNISPWLNSIRGSLRSR